MLDYNPLLNTDSYKPSHPFQYPENTEYVSSYIESRGCDIDDWTHTTYLGLQGFLPYLTVRITMEMVEEADKFLTAHGVPFHRRGWEYIVRKHDGKLPLKIQAIKEGTVLPQGHVLVQVVNTDPECYWLTSFIETKLLRAIWYPTTVATQDMYIKEIILKYLRLTSDSTTIDADVLFKLHGFGSRGASAFEAAAIGGAAHLCHFMGTDDLAGIIHLAKHYNEEMAGFSIPAAEHSTMMLKGEAGEIDQIERMIDIFGKPGALFAIVIDAYNHKKFLDKIYKLKDKLIASGATMVVRPDSGIPWEVAPDVILHLIDLFGAKVNSKGFMVLPDYLRVIYGDGINHESIEKILHALWREGLSADNIAFGMGGAMLQQVNRDTLKFAMKASASKIDGEWIETSKNPFGDSTKRSKPGVLALYKSEGEYRTVRLQDLPAGAENLLETFYLNGDIIQTTTWAEVRERAAEGLAKLENGLEEAA
jgi:nicotinamide phosphoribosyltransferase